MKEEQGKHIYIYIYKLCRVYYMMEKQSSQILNYVSPVTTRAMDAKTLLITQQWPWRYLFFFLLLCCSCPVSSARFYASQKLARTRDHLRRLNKPAVKSIQSPDGDIIDCVLLSQQPAFDHPRLKGHQIQKEAPEVPEGMKKKKKKKKKREVQENNEEDLEHVKLQLWHTTQERCPKGTVPMRRTTENDLLRTSKLSSSSSSSSTTRFISDYGKKKKITKPFHRRPPTSSDSNSNSSSSSSSSFPTALNENGHQHAIAYVEGDAFYGAKAMINVWGPSIDVSNEFSLSQLWLLAGSFEGDLNSIEAGWQVSPDLYGDNNTRLFTYWTSDSYQATGCYNLLCSGFIQINEEIALGASISPVSSYEDRQFDIDILIWKDPRGGDWWMSLGEEGSSVMGYWPSMLFSKLGDYATMVEWGGEVVNSEPGGRHTRTQMGSGHFPVQGFGRASYFSNLHIVDKTNNLRPPPNLNTFSDNPSCYDVLTGFTPQLGYFFYYGGPGLSDDCP